MNEIPVSFRSGDLTLEGLIANPGGNAPAAVVCHPHPMYGGSMYNNVVDAILAAMWQTGYATLRFNFRGVGASEGEHDGGPGEVDDAIAATAFMLAQPGVCNTGRGDGGVFVRRDGGGERGIRAGGDCANRRSGAADRDGRCANPRRRDEAGAAGIRRSRFVLAGGRAAGGEVENRRRGATRDRRGRGSFLRRLGSGTVARD